MNLLSAVRKSMKVGKNFYFYYDDGSRSEYEVTKSGLLLNEYGDFATFGIDKLLSNKFTFKSFNKCPSKHGELNLKGG